ncbi:acyl-CoA dehydrogenase family protein [Promethearchaeum syntrophicum]|uniref:Acyl-CoA dehydrogenase family protein n=1 Tax=Promethearchaeum syntrophicum TaxID=2594042 RepID=A0A5B9DEE8_9ARCH|nr:acyl-CoA dehydrogenase [Candidatus Prometheoarchaeum syntrophicum]
MKLNINEALYTNLLEKNYEKALNLKNRYSFINANLFPILSKEERDMVSDFQEKNVKLVSFSNEAYKNGDAYALFPKWGENYQLQRMNPYDGNEGSCKRQMLLNLCNVSLSPEADMAATASSILVGNSLFHNPNRTEIQEKALKKIYNGQSIGGIGITEIDHGSDAVNMKMQANIGDDGSITYNGTKIYTTNGAVADYFSSYGVTDISNPRMTMMLTLFERGDEGLKTERLRIPGAEGIGVGKVTYDNVTVPADRMLAKPGEGYKRLFRGLTPERVAIIGAGIAGIWSALAHGVIYSQIRHQFGKPLFKNQGISHTLDDIYSKAAAYTAFAFQIADFYDKKVGNKIHHGEKPNPTDEGSVAVQAAQGKYLISKFYNQAAYEVVQTMGGRGSISEFNSNSSINRLENLSRLIEVLGGHRNIQLMIIEMGLKGTTAMSITGNVQKAKRQERKIQNRITELNIKRAESILVKEAKFLSDGTKAELTMIISKIKEATEAKNKIEQQAYTKALPKALRNAGKEVHKAKKAR